MKTIRNLKLREIVHQELNISEMKQLTGGVNDGIMLLAYGCYNYVCTNSRVTSANECTTAKCVNVSCSSGA